VQFFKIFMGGFVNLTNLNRTYKFIFFILIFFFFSFRFQKFEEFSTKLFITIVTVQNKKSRKFKTNSLNPCLISIRPSHTYGKFHHIKHSHILCWFLFILINLKNKYIKKIPAIWRVWRHQWKLRRNRKSRVNFPLGNCDQQTLHFEALRNLKVYRCKMDAFVFNLRIFGIW
jgi:hypothetical protein